MKLVNEVETRQFCFYLIQVDEVLH